MYSTTLYRLTAMNGDDSFNSLYLFAKSSLNIILLNLINFNRLFIPLKSRTSILDKYTIFKKPITQIDCLINLSHGDRN